MPGLNLLSNLIAAFSITYTTPIESVLLREQWWERELTMKSTKCTVLALGCN